MGLFDTINFAFNNYSSNLAALNSYAFSSGGFSSYAPLFNFNGGGNSYFFGGGSYTPYFFSAPKANSYNFSFTPSTKSYSSSGSSFGNLTLKRSATGDLQRDLVNNACSWIGKVNNDATGNRLFSPNGRSQAWCADFVTYNTKQTFGNKLPSSFGSSSVSGLMNWGKNNNCYIDVASTSNKADFIAQNVKPGDLMIEKRGGKSHTGIVTKVNSDGSFETVEGNTSNKVAKRRYSANSSTLSGFVSLDKYVA